MAVVRCSLPSGLGLLPCSAPPMRTVITGRWRRETIIQFAYSSMVWPFGCLPLCDHGHVLHSCCHASSKASGSDCFEVRSRSIDSLLCSGCLYAPFLTLSDPIDRTKGSTECASFSGRDWRQECESRRLCAHCGLAGVQYFHPHRFALICVGMDSHQFAPIRTDSHRFVPIRTC